MKYKVGDKLTMGSYKQMYWVVTSIQNGTQYILQAHESAGGALNGEPMVLDIASVDSDPLWHKIGGTISTWMWVGLGVAVVALAGLGYLELRKRHSEKRVRMIKGRSYESR